MIPAMVKRFSVFGDGQANPSGPFSPAKADLQRGAPAPDVEMGAITHKSLPFRTRQFPPGDPPRALALLKREPPALGRHGHSPYPRERIVL